MKIELKVDKRTELLGVIEYLSNYSQHYPNLLLTERNPEYFKKLKDKFGNFRNHETISLFSACVDKLNFSYDSPVDLFLNINEDFTYDKEKMKTDNFVDRLESSPLITAMLDTLAKFASDINFDSFYNEMQTYYNHELNKIDSILKKYDVSTFMNEFYNKNIDSQSFVINLLPYQTNGNFGVRTKSAITCNTGVKINTNMVPYFICDCPLGITLLIHEFAHSYVNPVIMSLNFDYFTSNYRYDSQTQIELAYGDMSTYMCEHFVRAVESAYLYSIGEEEVRQKRKLQDIECEFELIEECISAMIGFYNIKDKDKDFDAYLAKVCQQIFHKAFEKEIQKN